MLLNACYVGEVMRVRGCSLKRKLWDFKVEVAV